MVQTNNQQQQTAALSDSPQVKILHSSEALGWNEIIIEKRYYSAGEHIFPCSSFYMIGLYLGPPLRVEIVSNEKPEIFMITHGSVHISPPGTMNIWKYQTNAEHVHIFLTPALMQQVAVEYGWDHTAVLNQCRAQDLRIEHISLALLTEVLEGGLLAVPT